jgi:hypothetical protein
LNYKAIKGGAKLRKNPTRPNHKGEKSEYRLSNNGVGLFCSKFLQPLGHLRQNLGGLCKVKAQQGTFRFFMKELAVWSSSHPKIAYELLNHIVIAAVANIFIAVQLVKGA